MVDHTYSCIDFLCPDLFHALKLAGISNSITDALYLQALSDSLKKIRK